MRRPIAALALLLLAGVCASQTHQGTYKPANGTPVSWSINEHQALIWGGQPYLPVGVRIDGTVGAVTAAKAAGINDVIVDLPANGAGWDAVFAALNKAGMRFLLRIDSLCPMARGFAVEPQGYRVAGIMKERHISLEIPGASSAFVVLATKSDATIVAMGRVPVVNGRLEYDAKPGPEIEHVLLIYPEMTGIEQPDYWENLDSERDLLLGSLKRHPPGPGLRGIVNPLGRSISLPGKEPRFVPTSPYFAMEFRNFLEDKYKTVETVVRTWSVDSSALTQFAIKNPDDPKKQPVATFDMVARLVPMWTTTRGISGMLDPKTNTIIQCDDRHSQAWQDISAVIASAAERRFENIVRSIHSVADVPIVQEWQGWAAPYESKTAVVDGIGMRVTGTTPSLLADTGSRAASSVLRWLTPGWLVATDIDLGTGSDAASQMQNALDDLGSMGAKGFFVHSETPAVIKTVSAESARRAVDSSLASYSTTPIFFPENAYNPAAPQRLPGGHWWMPCPADGDRVDLGSMFFAYRLKMDSGMVAIWAKKPGRYRLHMANPKLARFQALDGSDPLVKLSKDGVEVSLTDAPLIITGTEEVPIPEVALLETVSRIQTMVAAAESRHRDTSDIQYALSDDMKAFDRNPDGSFAMVRHAYWQLASAISPYDWIDAEHCGDTNFSEVIDVPGCADGRALSLRTLVPPDAGGYYAEYSIPVKSKEDQDIWIAAKVPPERRGDLSVSIGGQQMKLSGDPVSLYGPGFGWYKLGTTRIAGNVTKLRIEVDTPSNAEVAIDTILVTPSSFTPNGVYAPDPMNFRAIQIKQPTKGGKRKGSGGL